MENTEITLDELRKMSPEEYVLIDVRDRAAYEMGNIPGSVQIPRPDILDGSAELPRGKKIILCCMFGILSREAAEILRGKGIDAYNLEGGYGKYLVETMQEDEDNTIRREEIEKSLRKKFKKSIMSKFVHAVSDYDLIQPGDRIAVCISGGKDSMLMAKCFQELSRRNKIPFETVFLVMNPGYTDVTLGMIQSNAKLLGIPITMFESDIFDAVYTIKKSPCYLCARMRRGHLYNKAKELGCNKIALGHHFDDVIETTLMSILYSGQTQTMMPKLHSTNFEGMELIRPMYLIREDDIRHWRDYNGLQFIRCACRFTDTCSIDENSPATGDSRSKRIEAKRLIAQLKKTNPNIESNIFRSMENIHLNAVLGYKKDGNYHSFLEEYDN
ncbi:MAG: ATP-binding protein [Bilifractor sp.]|jgi:tRNA 2-thiocytidine biosynthesis protein TtcA